MTLKFKVGDRVSHSLRESCKHGRSTGIIVSIMDSDRHETGGSFRVQYDGEPPDSWKNNISWGCYLTKLPRPIRLLTLCLR